MCTEFIVAVSIELGSESSLRGHSSGYKVLTRLWSIRALLAKGLLVEKRNVTQEICLALLRVLEGSHGAVTLWGQDRLLPSRSRKPLLGAEPHTRKLPPLF